MLLEIYFINRGLFRCFRNESQKIWQETGDSKNEDELTSLKRVLRIEEKWDTDEGKMKEVFQMKTGSVAAPYIHLKWAWLCKPTFTKNFPFANSTWLLSTYFILTATMWSHYHDFSHFTDKWGTENVSNFTKIIYLVSDSDRFQTQTE